MNSYSLIMQCFNLPGFSYRYENTGIFFPYAYLYTDTEEDQDVPPILNININCNEDQNKLNPHCLKDISNSIYDIIKTSIPDYSINFISDSIFKLSLSAKFLSLKMLKEELTSFIENEKIKKRTMQELIYYMKIISDYSSIIDCTIFCSGTTNNEEETINNSQYKECRNKKKEYILLLIEIIEKYFEYEKIEELIKEGISGTIEENFKNILFLIYRMTMNSDSIKEEKSDILFKMVFRLIDKFEDLWILLQNELLEDSALNSTIRAVKKDISNLYIKILTNLINIIHFNEIDGYIQTNSRTKSGIMKNEQGKKLQNYILNFIKYFNEFGNNTYKISNSIQFNVTIINNEEINVLSEVKQDNIISFSDKGIYVVFDYKKLMKEKGGHSIQFVLFDSPLIPIRRNKNDDKDCTVRDFISISIFDKNGNEININDIPNDSKPIILYNKTFHKNLKQCFYYNISEEDLEIDGVETEDNYLFNNEKYLKCTYEHLTSFTAGDYIEPSSEENSKENENLSTGLELWAILLIIFSIIIILVIIIVVFIICRKRGTKNDDIEESVKSMDKQLI